MVPLLVALGLAGCTEPPVFNGVTEVIVKVQDGGGVKNVVLEGEKLANAIDCLYSTQEIAANEQSPDVIQEVLLVQVKDRIGDRMFEFVTQENFSGNKGKHYRNECLYRIIKSK